MRSGRPGCGSTCCRPTLNRPFANCSASTSIPGWRRTASFPDLAAAKAELDQSQVLQARIWSEAVAAARSSPTVAATSVLLPALNEMFDIVTTRTAATRMHPPVIIYVLLFALALLGALFAGSAMAGTRTRASLHVIGFAVMMAASVYLILDLEFPRIGLIRIDAMDQLLVDVRASFD